MFDSDNFGRQWLTRGLAPRLKMHPCVSLYCGTLRKCTPYVRLTTIVKCTPLPAATLWYNCTPASFATFCSTLPSYTWYSTTTLQTSLAVENHSIQSPLALQLCFCLFQASKSRVYDHLTSLYDTSYIVYHKTWLPNQKTTI